MSIGGGGTIGQPVQHAERAGEGDGVGDPAGGHRVLGSEVVLGQLLGEDEQPTHPRIARCRRILPRGGGQRPAPVPGRLDRPDEGGAHLVVLELAYGRRGGAARGGDPLAQHGRMLAGLPEQLGRAEHRLHHQLGGDVAGQAEMHAGLDHGLDDEEQVRGPGAGDRGHGVLVALGHRHHPAGGRQDLGDPIEMILVAVRARRRSPPSPRPPGPGCSASPGPRRCRRRAGPPSRRCRPRRPARSPARRA